MAAGKINLQKESGGIVKISPADGVGVTELVVPESGNLVSVDTAVTDNSIARYDGATGKLQNSSVIIDDNNNVGIGVTPSSSLTIKDGLTLIQQFGNSTPRPAVTSGVQKYGVHVGTGNADDGFLRLSAGGGTNSYAKSYIDISGYSVVSDMSMNIVLGTFGSERMRINASGNVGIGTTIDNGVDKLQVNGSITSKSSEYKYSNLNNACTVNENTIVDYTCLNIPIIDYGYVSVSVANPYIYCMQTFTPLNTPVRLFIRVLAGGSWSAWAEK